MPSYHLETISGGSAVSGDQKIENLNDTEAAAELARLAFVLTQANRDYHTQDAPRISDADYDALRREMRRLKPRFHT